MLFFGRDWVVIELCIIKGQGQITHLNHFLVMTLTQEDIGAIKLALMNELNPQFAQINQQFTQIDQRFEQIDQKFEDLTHNNNIRFVAIEQRLDSIEYRIGRIEVFVPVENAYFVPPLPPFPARKPREKK